MKRPVIGGKCGKGGRSGRYLWVACPRAGFSVFNVRGEIEHLVHFEVGSRCVQIWLPDFASKFFASDLANGVHELCVFILMLLLDQSSNEPNN